MLLITAAMILCAYNIIVTNYAGKTSVAVAQQLERIIPTAPPTTTLPTAGSEIEYPDYILNPNMDMPVEEIDGAAYIGLLEIPNLELELPVQSEWSYPNMRISPCRYEGSIYLNNMVICAHNYTTHFRPLFNIENGASVYFTDVDGNRFEYQVMETEILAENDVDKMVSGNWDLTLFTCTPGGVSRVTVRCVLISSSPKY